MGHQCRVCGRPAPEERWIEHQLLPGRAWLCDEHMDDAHLVTSDGMLVYQGAGVRLVLAGYAYGPSLLLAHIQREGLAHSGLAARLQQEEEEMDSSYGAQMAKQDPSYAPGGSPRPIGMYDRLDQVLARANDELDALESSIATVLNEFPSDAVAQEPAEPSSALEALVLRLVMVCDRIRFMRERVVL